jgi:hypothetical protein
MPAQYSETFTISSRNQGEESRAILYFQQLLAFVSENVPGTDIPRYEPLTAYARSAAIAMATTACLLWSPFEFKQACILPIDTQFFYAYSIRMNIHISQMNHAVYHANHIWPGALLLV